MRGAAGFGEKENPLEDFLFYFRWSREKNKGKKQKKKKGVEDKKANGGKEGKGERKKNEEGGNEVGEKRKE